MTHFTILVVTLALIFVSQRLYEQPLFNYSLTAIPLLQGTGISSFWFHYSIQGFASIVIWPFFILFILTQQSVCTMYCLNWMMLSSAVTMLKMGNEAPRPYWLNPEITPLTCSSSYGSPSGHTLQSFGNLVFVWLCCREQVTNRIASGLFTVAAWGLPLLMAFTRVIGGVHSLDQVLFGAMLGIYIAWCSFLVYHSSLKDHFRQIGAMEQT